MKISQLLTFATAAIIAVGVFLFAACSPGTAADSTIRQTHTVSFTVDGETQFTQQVNYGECATVPPQDETDGAPFIEWTFNSKPYDFTQPVTRDTVIVGHHKTYEIKFVAEGKTVAIAGYEYYGQVIEEPELPHKDGYYAEWEEYKTAGGNIVVNAVYTAINYSVKFVMDNTVLCECICTIDNFNQFLPKVEEKFGYELRWTAEQNGENYYIVYGEYVPKIFTANYYADGKLAATVVTSFGEEREDPAIPFKQHYDGHWGEFNFLDDGNAEVHAVYTPKKYSVNFVADAVTQTRFYDVENTSVEIPDVPVREHYTGKWQDFILDGGDKTVYAEYSPITYEVVFVADGKVVATEYYTVENNQVAIPQVPAKESCIGEWENFELNGGNVTVNAIYTRVNGTDGLVYETDGDGLKVKGYTGVQTDVLIPTEHDGKRVKTIGESAFADNCTIENITICQGVQIIGQNAFANCAALKTVNLPDSVTEIMQGAFMGCIVLPHIDLPDKIEVLSEGVFGNCGLKSVGLPSNLLKIEKNAFNACVELKSIIIPDATKEICTAAFANCTSLESVTFGTGLENIRIYAFIGCDKLASATFSITEGWRTINESLITDVSNILTDPTATANLFRDKVCEFERIITEKAASQYGDTALYGNILIIAKSCFAY